MPPKKNRVKVSSLKGIKLYNFLLKQLGEQNKKSSSKQILGIESRRKIVSKLLYPKYKALDKINIGDIRKDISSIVKDLPPKEICNPLYLPESYLSYVEYFEIDNHIRNVLPDCLDVRVNAGYLGKTKIFNTNGYSYYTNGVRKIIENIRTELKENKSGIAYFDGVVKVKPNKKDDGTPENYFVDYVLYINDEPEADDEPIDFKLPKKEQKKKEQIIDYMSGRFKNLQKEKQKRKRAAKKAAPVTEKERKKQVTKQTRAAINALKVLLKAKQITPEEFEKTKSSILAIRKK